MAKYRVEDIRNIALVGHGAAGKTSLADSLLFKAGAVDRRGSVDDGSSVSDYDDEEKSAISPLTPAFCIWSTKASKSICWTRLAIRISSAAHSKPWSPWKPLSSSFPRRTASR